MFYQVVHEQAFQQDMEGVTMIMVAEVAEFMDEDIVLQDLRQTDEVQIEIYVRLGRTAAPVGGVMLDGDTVVDKTVAGGELCQTRRQDGLRRLTHVLDFLC